MKHEVTTLNTKRTLAASLKKFMQIKPLSKITVSEIIADCKVNRKTFYYHFEDIYALLKWMLEQEAVEVVKHFDLSVDYKNAIYFVVDYVRNNKHLLCCAYDGIGRADMKRFFYADFIGIVRSAIDNTERQLCLNADESLKTFLAQFYTEAIAGLLINEFTNNECHDPSEAVEYFSLILKSSLPHVLMSAANKDKG